ncbi:uncharacterized protein [Solanum tuberosum]|uniref:uncharacterized protein n=1 Tax=Solanum tuberosum TaxID=4113 RepID=UPI00073A49E7|nr:PREDICTED: uncharacterized protein LOC107062903 [Solanum tuberosum]
MGHRRFLPLNHKWMNDKKSFDGTVERRLPPNTLSGDDILDQVADLDGLPLTNDQKKKVKVSHDSRVDNWNKKSIVFDLPYWKTLKELHPKANGEKYELPTTCFTLSPEEKHTCLSFLRDLKVPDGFSSNISHCINMKDHKISGLKCHDCHVLLQHLIPLAIRSMLCNEVCEPLIELSSFFNLLGAKCLKLEELEQINAQIPETICKLEKVFLPSFFNVMERLPVHLANEVMIGGPVQYRSMYQVERWYLHTMETKFNLLERNDDGVAVESNGGLMIFCQPGKALKGGKPHLLDLKEMEQAHIYILKNCDEVQPFLEEFSQIPGDSSKKNWIGNSSVGLKKRFHVQDYDNGLRTQNCGIVVASETGEDDRIIDYYGELTEILELQFVGGRRLVLFICMWFDVYDNERRVKMDEYDFVSVNPQRFLKTDETFVLANQVSQVFYARDHSNKAWNVVRKFLPCDSFDDVQENDHEFKDLHDSIDRKRKRTHTSLE